ncbi:amidase domain-containing protein [Streptomyces sp. NPDC059080]|uniref:amidase domain-containing protein n=1 Tax=Streptomyces sp. NPDC059080 TaxID=3346718 RepID=UPI00368D76B3
MSVAVWAGCLGGTSTAAELAPTAATNTTQQNTHYIDPHLPDANGNIPANQEGPPKLINPAARYVPEPPASPPPSLSPAAKALAASPVSGHGTANWARNHVGTKWEYKQDCANFVSKALYYGGGMKMRPGGRKADNAWWQGKYGFGKSWAWTSANYLRLHVTKWRHSKVIAKDYNAQLGDLVFFKWKKEKIYNHVAIVDSKVQGRINLVQHGLKDQTSLADVINRYKNTKNPIQKVTIVRVRDRK